jgi:threonine-phosphate decarboxylase
MKAPAHGGDVYTPRFEKQAELLDFSSNISPLGLPAGVTRVITENPESFSAYPDPLSRSLRAALSAHHKVAMDRIVCGNGAADLIYRIAQWRRPKSALLIAPGFSEYEKALREAQTDIRLYRLADPDFGIREDFPDSINRDVDLLFLCNPNNPTGVTVEPALMEQILDRAHACGTTVVIDECFNEFLADPLRHSVVGYLDRIPHLIVLKAFTKTYAMAGFRLGYILCGDAKAAEDIADTGQPWSVSAIAQAAGVSALQDTDYVVRLRKMISIERDRMKKELTAAGVTVLGGEANYIFFRVDRDAEGARTFFSQLIERGILVRSCANYHGLDDRYFRAAVRAPGENDLFLKAVREALIIV